MMRSYLYEAELLVAAVAALVLFTLGRGDETYLAGKAIDWSVTQAEQRAADFKAELKQSLAGVREQAQQGAAQALKRPRDEAPKRDAALLPRD